MILWYLVMKMKNEKKGFYKYLSYIENMESNLFSLSQNKILSLSTERGPAERQEPFEYNPFFPLPK